VGFSASEKFFKNIFFDFELDYLKSVFFVQALLKWNKVSPTSCQQWQESRKVIC